MLSRSGRLGSRFSHVNKRLNKLEACLFACAERYTKAQRLCTDAKFNDNKKRCVCTTVCSRRYAFLAAELSCPSGLRHADIPRARHGVSGANNRSEQLLQLTSLLHLSDDVRAADKVTINEELRNSRPLRILFNLLSQRTITLVQTIEADESVAQSIFQDSDDTLAKSTTRGIALALHEEDDAIIAQDASNLSD